MSDPLGEQLRALPAPRPTGPPRVLYVLTASFGLEKTLAGQLRYLRSAGFEPFFACCPGPELQRFASAEGAPGEAIPMEREIAPLRDLQSLWRLWRLTRRIRPSITNVSAPKAGLLGGLAAWLAGVPCRVYTVRGLRLETTRGPKYFVLWAAEWLACRLSHRVVCVSCCLARRVVELRLARPEKVLVVASGSSNGVDAPRFAPGPKMARRRRRLLRRLGIPAGAPVLGFVGRLTRDKGIAELVAAYERLRQKCPTLRLLLVGCFESGDPVPGAVRAAIERDPGIIATGFVDDPAPYYHLMDVVALPTRREGYPTVALEAAAACRPFVTTRVTGAAEAVEDGKTGLLVPAGDVVALARAVKRLLVDPPWAVAMAARAHRQVVHEFAPQRVWRALEKIYRDLLQQHDRPAGPGRRPALLRPPSDSSTPVPARWALGAGKRWMDIAGSLLGLAVAAPVLLLAAGLIRCSMGRPVLFLQRRTGLAGMPFSIYKLRTLVGDGEGGEDPQRLTPAGALLRRWSIDELPQLWNVLRGEMSLVGPRPLPVRYMPRYTPDQRRRHEVRPGLTGWAQVCGRNRLSWEQRFKLDLWYVEHAGLWLDLQILAASFALVLRGEGVTPPGAALMPEFSGEPRPSA